jgi:hypothetical protein
VREEGDGREEAHPKLQLVPSILLTFSVWQSAGELCPGGEAEEASGGGGSCGRARPRSPPLTGRTKVAHLPQPPSRNEVQTADSQSQ